MFQQAKGDNQKIKSQGEKEGRNAMIISKVKCTEKLKLIFSECGKY